MRLIHSIPVQWLCTFSIVRIMPIALENITTKTYFIFGCIFICAAPFVWYFIPETKGLSLEVSLDSWLCMAEEITLTLFHSIVNSTSTDCSTAPSELALLITMTSLLSTRAAWRTTSPSSSTWRTLPSRSWLLSGSKLSSSLPSERAAIFRPKGSTNKGVIGFFSTELTRGNLYQGVYNGGHRCPGLHGMGIDDRVA